MPLKVSQNIINAYGWAKRACNNGNEQGCQALAFFDDIKVRDVNNIEKQCNTEKDPKLKQDSCKLYDFYKMLNDGFKRIDKRYQ